MKRWLAEFRVESEVKLEDGLDQLLFKHEETGFEVRIVNAVKDAEPDETLTIHITFSAETLERAEALATSQLQRFLHLLTFVTNTGYKMTRIVCLADWSPGLSMRDMHVHTKAVKPIVIPALNIDILPTISTFFDTSPNPIHDRAMRWFASGVRADVMEDQFQYFWFVIELISNSTKSSGKVTDKCQKCKGDLYCKSCNELSQHKPFPKQAIATCLSKIGLADNLIQDFFDVRNSLMHGDTREMIEQMLKSRQGNPSLVDVTNTIGKAAWHCIFFHYQLEKDPGELVFFDANGYVKSKMSGKAHIQTIVPGELKIENLSLPQVSLTSKLQA